MKRLFSIAAAVTMLACSGVAQDAASWFGVLAASATPTTVDTNLLAWYKLDGDALDATTNNYDGSWTGTPVYTTGHDGQGAMFSVAERIDTTAKIPASSGDFTVSAWVNILAHTNSYLAGQFNNIGSNPGRFLFYNLAEGETLRIQFSTKRDVTGVSTNVFTHLAFTRISNVCTAYCDGARIGETFNNGAALVDVPFQIGGTETFANRNSRSIIDDVRIYKRGLSSNDVNRIYQGLLPNHD